MLPIGVLVFPVGYLLCFYPVNKVYSKLMACLKYKQCVQIMVPLEMATAPESSYVSLPSDTVFIVPHPDEPELSDHEISSFSCQSDTRL